MAKYQLVILQLFITGVLLTGRLSIYD